jgi:hypothetical protein
LDGDGEPGGEGEGDPECEGNGDEDFDGSVRAVGEGDGTYAGGTYVGEGLLVREGLADADVGVTAEAPVATGAAVGLLEKALMLR